MDVSGAIAPTAVVTTKITKKPPGQAREIPVVQSNIQFGPFAGWPWQAFQGVWGGLQTVKFSFCKRFSPDHIFEHVTSFFTIVWLARSSLGGGLQERQITASLQSCLNHTSTNLQRKEMKDKQLQHIAMIGYLGGLTAPSQDALWEWGGGLRSKGLGN